MNREASTLPLDTFSQPLTQSASDADWRKIAITLKTPWSHRLEVQALGGGLEGKIEAAETTASRHGTPNLTALGKITCIVGDY